MNNSTYVHEGSDYESTHLESLKNKMDIHEKNQSDHGKVNTRVNDTPFNNKQFDNSK